MKIKEMLSHMPSVFLAMPADQQNSILLENGYVRKEDKSIEHIVVAVKISYAGTFGRTTCWAFSKYEGQLYDRPLALLHGDGKLEFSTGPAFYAEEVELGLYASATAATWPPRIAYLDGNLIIIPKAVWQKEGDGVSVEYFSDISLLV